MTACRRALPLALALAALAACKAAPPPRAASSTPATAAHTHRERGQPIVASSPQALMGKAAVKKLQHALGDKGLPTEETGILDHQTKDHLRSFQRQQKIAATGLPDQLTVTRLGLSPEEILGKDAPARDKGDRGGLEK